MKQRYFASCPKGFEGLLAKELEQLGAAEVKLKGAGAEFRGSWRTLYQVCLWSRLASRILYPLGDLMASSDDELYESIQKIPWQDHFSPKETFRVDVSLRSARMTHTQFVAQRVKDAIVDQFREKTGARPSVAAVDPEIRVHVHLHGEGGNVALDLGGGPLFHRGYRMAQVEAPLKENLAAALLLFSDWPTFAAQGRPLLDPMCGSGTLLIEAIAMAGDCAPGLWRESFGFLAWQGHDADIWKNVWREARERRKVGLAKMESEFFGYDIDATAVRIANRNLESAGFSDFAAIQHVGFSQATSREWKRPGLLITNPPYGERMGERNTLHGLYNELGTLFSEKFKGWQAGVFTGNPELGKFMGVRASGKRKLRNGPIACELLLFELESKNLLKTKAPANFTNEQGEDYLLSAGATMYRNRLKKRSRHLKKWARREGIACYRVYDADLPEYNVAVDLYEDMVVIQEYAAPVEIPQTEARHRLQEVLLVTPEVLGVSPKNIFLKERKRQKGRAQYNASEEREEVTRVVREFELKFLVNLSDYLDTGLFLDYRRVRRWIGEISMGKDFLNLFCYTGTATVYAAHGKARSTLSVDLSQTYLDWAKENMELNEFLEGKHEFVRSDCLEWLEDTNDKFDLILVDPPSFSNSKRMKTTFDVQRDHMELLGRIRECLRPSGTVIFSCNLRSFHLDVEAVGAMGFTLNERTNSFRSEDFQQRPKMHRVWELTI